jgi:CubicO group peptidase (beta-lactamase class C family)
MDDPVINYLPWFVCPIRVTAQITVRDLLVHR